MKHKLSDEERDFFAWLVGRGSLIQVQGAWGPIQICHVRHRGIGSKRVAHIGNTVPLYMSLHAEQHNIGMQSFERKYQAQLQYMTLAEHAGRLATAYRLEQTGLGE